MFMGTAEGNRTIDRPMASAIAVSLRLAGEEGGGDGVSDRYEIEY